MVSNSGYVKMEKTNKQARKASTPVEQKPAYTGKKWTRTDTKRQQQEAE